MSFEYFIEQCERFNNGQIAVEESGIAIKHLRALEIGNYGRYLENFYEYFESKNIKVIFYEDLNHHPQEMLAEICEFIDVSPSFYDDFVMHRANITFSARWKYLHCFVLSLNRFFGPILWQRPTLKRMLVKLYKNLNQERLGYAPMQEETREKLVNYYAPGNAKLMQILGCQKWPSWINS